MIKFNESNKDQNIYQVIRYKNGENIIIEKHKTKKVLDQNTVESSNLLTKDNSN